MSRQCPWVGLAAVLSLSWTRGAVGVRRHACRRSVFAYRPQHLSGLEMIRDLCAGRLEGADIGSTEITFTPQKIEGGSHTADTKTAGCVPLPPSSVWALEVGARAHTQAPPAPGTG